MFIVSFLRAEQEQIKQFNALLNKDLSRAIWCFIFSDHAIGGIETVGFSSIIIKKSYIKNNKLLVR